MITTIAIKTTVKHVKHVDAIVRAIDTAMTIRDDRFAFLEKKL